MSKQQNVKHLLAVQNVLLTSLESYLEKGEAGYVVNAIGALDRVAEELQDEVA